MRALVVVATLSAGGGIETALLNSLRSLEQPDLTIDIAVLGDLNGELVPQVRALGHKVWSCPLQMNPLRYVARYEAALRAHGPYDVIHNHAGDFAGPMLSAARRVGIPIRIAHYHNVCAGHGNDWKRRLYHRIVRRRVLRDATTIVGCSWAALQSWFPRDWATDSRMCVVRCGIDTRRFSHAANGGAIRRELGIPQGAPVIGHIGRFNWQKNQIGLIDAARLIVDQIPNARVMFVGNGPLRQQAERRAADLGIAANIVFAGHQSDVTPYLSAMDVFALPSVSEGFGLAAVEAQAAGLPVATTKLPGPYEAVASDFHRYAFEPTDTREMANSLLSLLEEVQQNRAMARVAREHAARFDLWATNHQMLSVWGYDVPVSAETTQVARPAVATLPAPTGGAIALPTASRAAA